MFLTRTSSLLKNYKNNNFLTNPVNTRPTENAFAAGMAASNNSLRQPLIQKPEQLQTKLNVVESDSKFIDDVFSKFLSFLPANESTLLRVTSKEFNRCIKQYLDEIGITNLHKCLYKDISIFLSAVNNVYTKEQIETIRSIILNPSELTSFVTTPFENYGLGLKEKDVCRLIDHLKPGDNNIINKLSRPFRTYSATTCCLKTNGTIFIAWIFIVFLIGPLLLATGMKPSRGLSKTGEFLFYYGTMYTGPIALALCACVASLHTNLESEDIMNKRLLPPEQADLLCSRTQNEMKKSRALFQFFNAILDYVKFH